MKKLICSLLVLALMLPLAACSEKQESIQKPVTFYYCRSTPVYGEEDGLIAGEIRESAGYEDKLLGLLNRYISGPVSPELVRPFPFAARILSCTVEEESVFLDVSDTFTVLKDAELTLALACLTKTIYDITGIGTIYVKAETRKFDGIETITMRIENIYLLDSSKVPADTE